MACTLERRIDQATLDVIIQLQREDAALYFGSSKGKSRDPTDEELAFQLHIAELGVVSQLLEDKRMAMSIAAAVQADGHVLTASQEEEENVLRDRDIARRWTGDECTASDDFELESTTLDDETVAKLRILYVEDRGDIEGFDLASTENEPAESSAQAARRAGRAHRRARSCIACMEQTDFVNVVRAPCQHEYCRSCLADLFKASMTDESLFPPRCCRQPINLTIAHIFLESSLVAQYEKKKVEFETPNRTYCYASGCGAFISTSCIDGDVASCSVCAHTTCTNCKKRAHTGDCPDDADLQQLLATAQDNGWQRCYSCWRIVELDHGCNHMVCRCRAEFCYNCGIQWKNCRCEQWDERRLLARAYQIIDREADQPAAPEGQLVRESQELPLRTQETRPENTDEESSTLIERTVQELRENHECRHILWNHVAGPHRCEECYCDLRQYIFECRQCRVQVCNRCRRNRF